MNPRVAAIAPSMIREIAGKKRPTSIDLGLGEPALRPDLAPLEAAMAKVAAEGIPYTANAGLPALRAAVARYHGYPGFTDAGVGITVGSQEALSVAVAALADPARDEALVVEPAYPLYAKLCQLFGVRVRAVALSADDDFTPRARTVLDALGPDTRLLFLASPNNPSGRVWPRAELEALAAGLAARPGPPLTIIADEVYRELWVDAPPTGVASLWPHTVTVGSLSKSCALTGLRLGWFLAPAAVAPALHKVHQFLVSTTTTFGQHAAVEIFERRPALLSAHRQAYVDRRRALVDALAAARLRHVPPDGAFYCLVRPRGPLADDSLQFALALLDREDVVVIPGAAFGAEGWVRVSYAGEPAALVEGVRRIAAFCDGRVG